MVAVVRVVGNNSVRQPDGGDNVPAENFLEDGSEVRQRLAIFELGKTTRTNHAIELLVCLLLSGRFRFSLLD